MPTKLIAILATAAAVGCGGASPDFEYPEYLPPTTAPPPMPATPRAYRPPTKTVAPAGVDTPSNEITCQEYCSKLESACDYHESGLSRPRARCLEDCRQWPAGTPGAKRGDTLACRMARVEEAKIGVRRACWSAATASSVCRPGPEIPRAPALAPAADTILGLYDSTDARSWDGGVRARRTILGGRVRSALRKLGLKIRLWDMNQGLPPRDVTARAAGIVTAFYDADLNGAAAYALWLRAQLEAGRRVVILNNYGAWREAGKDYVDERLPNLVFEAIGVRYLAQWTSRGALLATAPDHVDPTMFTRVPNPAVARHYYLFRPLSSDVRVHLGVTRSDLEDSLSAVVMTSPRGGLAISRYYENRDGDQHLAITRFLERSLRAK